jgi:hypothetical protein
VGYQELVANQVFLAILVSPVLVASPVTQDTVESVANPGCQAYLVGVDSAANPVNLALAVCLASRVPLANQENLGILATLASAEFLATLASLVLAAQVANQENLGILATLASAEFLDYQACLELAASVAKAVSLAFLAVPVIVASLALADFQVIVAIQVCLELVASLASLV